MQLQLAVIRALDECAEPESVAVRKFKAQVAGLCKFALKRGTQMRRDRTLFGDQPVRAEGFKFSLTE